MSCVQSLFGPSSQYIKVSDSSFVAIEGANVVDKMNLSELRMPYKQLLKGKILLKIGQEDYLLNHLGLGDNATFLAIKVTYDPKSVIEEDNYIEWKYYNNVTNVNTMAQMLVLTGNSTNRIPQLFLTNPSTKYPVTLEVMVAVIDENSSFFEYKPVVYFTDMVSLENAVYAGPYDTSLGNNFGATLSVTMSAYGGTISISDITGFLVDSVLDSNGVVLGVTDSNYLLYSDTTLISSVTASGTYSMYFDITDSLNNSVDTVDNISIYFDFLNYNPVVYFTSMVGLDGTYSGPYNTLDGDNFGATLSVTMSVYGGTLSVSDITGFLIDEVLDSNGFIMGLTDSNYLLYSGTYSITSVTASGTYSMYFDITDTLDNSVEIVENVLIYIDAL